MDISDVTVEKEVAAYKVNNNNLILFYLNNNILTIS
nr:MAG TPA: hypothetical protein [Caudoviricetes sp.]